MRRNQRAVAAVVGTLLALLVFLAIFGIFLTQYMPLWMTDNESSLSVTVENQFGEVDHTMETLYLQDKLNFAAYNPVTMSSSAVPVFSTPTVGSLGFTESPTIYTTVAFKMLGRSAPNAWYTENASTGTVSMSLPDRYYVPVALSLEDGAVVMSQGPSQQALQFQPSYVADSSGSTSNLYLTLFATYGNATSTSQAGTAEVYTTFLTSQTYQGIPGGTPVYLNFTTHYPCAWFNYWNQFNTHLNQTGYPTQPTVHATNAAGNPLPSGVNACTNSYPYSPVELHEGFLSITNLDLTVATFQVEVGTNIPS